MATSAVIYLQAALVITSLVIAIIFYMAWKTLGEKRWALNWSIAFVSSTFFWLVNLSSQAFPSHETYWLTVNAFGLAMITLALRGHCERSECQNLPKKT